MTLCVADEVAGVAGEKVFVSLFGGCEVGRDAFAFAIRVTDNVTGVFDSKVLVALLGQLVIVGKVTSGA